MSTIEHFPLFHRAAAMGFMHRNGLTMSGEKKNKIEGVANDGSRVVVSFSEEGWLKNIKTTFAGEGNGNGDGDDAGSDSSSSSWETASVEEEEEDEDDGSWETVSSDDDK